MPLNGQTVARFTPKDRRKEIKKSRRKENSSAGTFWQIILHAIECILYRKSHLAEILHQKK